MLKRSFVFILSLIVLASLLSSCFKGNVPENTTDADQASSAEETEKIVLSSFYATGGSSRNGYFNLKPQEGSPEAQLFDIICAEAMINGDVFPFLSEGETVKVVYEGNIEPLNLKHERGGIIRKVHSITLKNDPRTYGGVDYGVAIMRENYTGSKVSELDINAGKENMGYDILIAESSSEFEKYRDSVILIPSEIAGEMTDTTKESLLREEKRKELLSEYNDKFFEDNILLMVFIESGSGTLRYDVSDISIDNGTALITVDMLTQPPITDDMADWIIFVAIPKEVSASVTEYNTYMPLPEWYQ